MCTVVWFIVHVYNYLAPIPKTFELTNELTEKTTCVLDDLWPLSDYKRLHIICQCQTKILTQILFSFLFLFNLKFNDIITNDKPVKSERTYPNCRKSWVDYIKGLIIWALCFYKSASIILYYIIYKQFSLNGKKYTRELTNISFVLHFAVLSNTCSRFFPSLFSMHANCSYFPYNVIAICTWRQNNNYYKVTPLIFTNVICIHTFICKYISTNWCLLIETQAKRVVHIFV